MRFYKFHIGDYHSHTTHLDELEDLAYRRMLDYIYLHEEPLPDDIGEIARLIRMRTECERIANVLREFFDRTADVGYTQSAALKQIAEFNAKSEKAKQSADARWNKDKEKQKVTKKNGNHANALRPVCEGNANHKPLTITHKHTVSELVDQVRQLYPKSAHGRNTKREESNYKRAIKFATHDQILAAAKAYSKKVSAESIDDRYVMKLSNWLGDEQGYLADYSVKKEQQLDVFKGAYF